LIHQTVANKSRLSCEEKHAIESWKTLNPNHTHRLWDDADMRAFMVEVSFTNVCLYCQGNRCTAV
jgi:mannosyltransferase OCH1-like enzyme